MLKFMFLIVGRDNLWVNKSKTSVLVMGQLTQSENNEKGWCGLCRESPRGEKKTKCSKLAFNRFCTMSKVFNNGVSYITSTRLRSCSRWIFSDSCSKRNTNTAAWYHFAPETCLNLIEVDQNIHLIKYYRCRNLHRPS